MAEAKVDVQQRMASSRADRRVSWWRDVKYFIVLGVLFWFVGCKVTTFSSEDEICRVQNNGRPFSMLKISAEVIRKTTCGVNENYVWRERKLHVA